MPGDISFQPGNSILQQNIDNYYDARIQASTPGMIVYNDSNDQWIFKSFSLSESDYDVIRQLYLSNFITQTTFNDTVGGTSALIQEI